VIKRSIILLAAVLLIYESDYPEIHYYGSYSGGNNFTYTGQMTQNTYPNQQNQTFQINSSYPTYQQQIPYGPQNSFYQNNINQYNYVGQPTFYNAPQQNYSPLIPQEQLLKNDNLYLNNNNFYNNSTKQSYNNLTTIQQQYNNSGNYTNMLVERNYSQIEKSLTKAITDNIDSRNIKFYDFEPLGSSKTQMLQKGAIIAGGYAILTSFLTPVPSIGIMLASAFAYTTNSTIKSMWDNITHTLWALPNKAVDSIFNMSALNTYNLHQYLDKIIPQNAGKDFVKNNITPNLHKNIYSNLIQECSKSSFLLSSKKIANQIEDYNGYMVASSVLYVRLKKEYETHNTILTYCNSSRENFNFLRTIHADINLLISKFRIKRLESALKHIQANH